ncbi:hypothetical protein [Timonella senegalensis]|uniref:hypothetical protein n=1 Tax=Timonella senegalensis TaxID=1465825 RepID=UPI003898E4B6
MSVIMLECSARNSPASMPNFFIMMPGIFSAAARSARPSVVNSIASARSSAVSRARET